MDDSIKDTISVELTKRVKGCSTLAFPQSAARILELAKNPENGPPEFAVPIMADPGLTAQILRFVNSSFFGFRYKITTIQMALSLVCVRTIKNFVLWNAVFALLPNPRIGPFKLRRVFQDALRRGVFSKVFASYFDDLDPEELFVVGLFQDVAIPILAQIWPNEYEKFLVRIKDEGGRLSQLEQSTFHWDHAEAGAILAREWGLGEEFAQCIAFHTHPASPPDNTKLWLTKSIVSLSSLLPSAEDETWNDADAFFTQYYKIAKKPYLGSKGAPIPSRVFEESDALYPDLLKITNMPEPTKTLVEFQNEYFQTSNDS